MEGFGMRCYQYSCTSLLFGFTLIALMLTGWLEIRVFESSLDLPLDERGKWQECVSVVFVTYYFSFGVGAFTGGVLGLIGIGDISKRLALKILLAGISCLSSFVLYLATA